MNERIRELAKEAAREMNETGTYSEPKFQEKFAELIVRECMWKIMTCEEEAIDNNWRVDEAMSAAISDISEHFGVKQ
jgi:hypothetical protein